MGRFTDAGWVVVFDGQWMAPSILVDVSLDVEPGTPERRATVCMGQLDWDTPCELHVEAHEACWARAVSCVTSA